VSRAGTTLRWWDTYVIVARLEKLTDVLDLEHSGTWTFWLSVALVVIAAIVRFAHISPVDAYAAWIETAGYLVLVAGCIFKTT
jgi:hypothetical protein